jgi:MinD superfamily P-loop ATPase
VAFFKEFPGENWPKASGSKRLLVDGPPRHGGAVHATLSGADRLLLVAEPGLSGIHDAERVLDLADRFGVAVALCVNKWDLDPEGSDRLERLARENGALFVGKIRYDTAFKEALRQGKDLLAEAPQSGGADDIRSLWQKLEPID